MAVTLFDSQSMMAGHGRWYIEFSVTDAPTGNPQFRGSDSHFISNNTWGGTPVYPVVHSWGDLSKSRLVQDPSFTTITFVANSYWVPYNSTSQRRTVAEWFRILNLRDVEIAIYQWNQCSVNDVAYIWNGFVSSVEQCYMSDGLWLIDMTVNGTEREFAKKPVGELITKEAFPSAPNESISYMVPRTYGGLISSFFSGAGRNSIAYIGHPTQGARGIIVDENEDTAKVKVRFNKHDGTDTGHTFTQASSTLQPLQEADLWIYDSGMNAYGVVDKDSYTVDNSTSALDVTILKRPVVHFFIKPQTVGTTHASGLTEANNLFDSDLNNFIETTSSHNIVSFLCPQVSAIGEIIYIWVWVDWANGHATENREIVLSFWDVYKSGGAGHLNNINSLSGAKAPGSGRQLFRTSVYGYNDFNNHAGTSTRPEFLNGRFVTRNTSDANEAFIEMRLDVANLSSPHDGLDGVQVFNMGMIVTVSYPFVSSEKNQHWATPGRKLTLWEWINDRFVNPGSANELRIGETSSDSRRKALQRLRGTDFFATGSFMKDAAGGTYTGSGGSVIERPCDIAAHILSKLNGETRNSSSASNAIGSFVHARDTVLANMAVFARFGPELVTNGEAIQALCDRFPMSVFQESGQWQCIPDDMNPHSSRLYRSTTDQLFIEPHDIQRGSFRQESVPAEGIVNKVDVNVAHGYPDRESGFVMTYEHKLSQKWFGLKSTDIIDEPWLRHGNYDTDTNNPVLAYVEWQGRRNAMPRLPVSCVVTQKFWDLRRGHIVQFRGLELAGITCQAFRCGLLHYYFKSSIDTVDQCNSTAPTFLGTGITDAIYIGLPQQVDGITFSVGTAATFTNGGWQFSAGGNSWTSFSGVTNTDALKSTGTQRVSWTWPTPTSWKKEEKLFGAFGIAGPCYWVRMNYSAVGVAGTGNARIATNAEWRGRLFEVLEVSRQQTGTNGYPAMYAMFKEVM